MTATKLCMLSAALASTDAIVGAAPAAAQTCAGDWMRYGLRTGRAGLIDRTVR